MPRIKIKSGNFEFEYEGDQLFIEEKVKDLVQSLIGGLEQHSEIAPAEVSSSVSTNIIQISTNTIAQMIDSKTGSDLVTAAIAKIQIVEGKNSASRSEILAEMREATTYFKETFASNLSAYLDNLVKSKRLNLVSRQTYAMPAAERSKFNELLASV